MVFAVKVNLVAWIVHIILPAMSCLNIILAITYCILITKNFV